MTGTGWLVATTFDLAGMAGGAEAREETTCRAANWRGGATGGAEADGGKVPAPMELFWRRNCSSEYRAELRSAMSVFAIF
ncbi:hypothetical protein OAJ57_04735 [Alphaproteobacteria bacterium]|nr:hypothetical protein [Alphaproteobacteria bacterium]